MLLLATLASVAVGTSPVFVEASARLGLDALSASRVAVADFNIDGRPDLVVARERVFLNMPDAAAPHGFRFVEVPSSLVHPGDDGVATFADLTNDGVPDAIAFRSVNERQAAGHAAASDTAPHAWWQRGKGDGTFEGPIAITATTPKTACAIAVGDIDRDGRNDLFVGNWYVAYGERLDAYAADALLNRPGDDGSPRFERLALPEDEATFDTDTDLAGRPLYGALIADVLPASRTAAPQLLALAYGRRWNRLYAKLTDGWSDVAPRVGIDGDADRGGTHAPGIDRPTERPFRANGNTFDAAIGDIDGDGRFDLAIAEIAHWWAGPSSDRTRLLFAREADNAVGTRFDERPECTLDRFDVAQHDRWNQGDLFIELADVDLDGRLDVVLASGDYPDPPPFDERLRILCQRALPDCNGRLFEDRSLVAGIDHIGCGQIAVADFDCDGRVDIVAGQSFTRFTPEMRDAAGGTPTLRLWLNRSQPIGHALSLRLSGDPAHGVAAQPFGAVVTIVTQPTDGTPSRTLVRQLAGPGGHAGKASEPLIHASLESAEHALVAIRWPATPPFETTHEIRAGRRVIRCPGREGDARSSPGSERAGNAARTAE